MRRILTMVERRFRRLFVPEQMDQLHAYAPLLIHVHIPKNAGTSFNTLLDESFGDAHLKMYTKNPRQKHTYHTMLETLHRYPHVKVISSHSFNSYPHKLGPRLPLYLCFIRDPIDRHLSYYRYCKKNYHELSAEHCALLPVDFEEMSVVDFFTWQFESDRRKGITANRQVQYVARVNNLDLAIDILSNFFFVGVTDQMSRGIALLREKLRPYGLHLIDRDIGKENVTNELYHETKQLGSEPAVEAYFKNLDSDMALYRWAGEAFEREAGQYGI